MVFIRLNYKVLWFWDVESNWSYVPKLRYDLAVKLQKYNKRIRTYKTRLKGYIGKNPKDRERHARILEEEPAQHLKWQEDLDRHKWPRSTKWKHKLLIYTISQWQALSVGGPPTSMYKDSENSSFGSFLTHAGLSLLISFWASMSWQEWKSQY